MATKLAADLRPGDILVMQFHEDAPERRLVVTGNKSDIGTLDQNNRRITGLQLDGADAAVTRLTSFITEGDSEFELATLTPLNSKPVSNENAAFIAEEAFKAGFTAGQDAADDNEWGEPARLKAWRSYEPPQDVLSRMAGTPDPEER